jgi:hypothetical protein
MKRAAFPRLLGLERLDGLWLLVRSRFPRMRGCRRHHTPSPRLGTTISGEGGFGRIRLMPFSGRHVLGDLFIVRKEERLGGETVEQDVVDREKLEGLRHQLANGLRPFV